MRGMRPPSGHLPSVPLQAGEQRGDWNALRTLIPYLWAYRGRVLFAIACLIAAKIAVVGVPILLKHVVDALDPAIAGPELVVPVALVVLYGLRTGHACPQEDGEQPVQRDHAPLSCR